MNTLVTPSDVSKSTAACKTSQAALVSGRDISLGTFKIHMSRKGMLANECGKLAWWLNGFLYGNRGSEPNVSEATVDVSVKDREEHALLELRRGDLLAFRFKESSYYCYKHLSEMLVNGTDISTASEGVSTRYSREYSSDWFLPSYVLDESNTADDETDLDLSKFLLPREKMLGSDTEIVPGVDYFEPRDDSDPDHKRSNFYWRIQI